MRITPLLLLFLLFTTSAYAAKANCKGYFANQQYTRAASCFLRQSESIPLSPKSSPISRYRKGRLLRNASICLEKAAQKSKDPQQAAFLREKGLMVITKYLRKKLFEINIREKQAQQMRKTFLKRIQYATIILHAQYGTSICLRGFRYKRCFNKTSWSGRLRPGKWDIHITFSNKAESVRTIILKPEATQRKRFKRPTAKVPLTMLTGSNKAKLTLNSLSLERTLHHTGSKWSLSLLPSRYHVTLTYPGQKSWTRTFVLHRQQPKTFSWGPKSPGLVLTSQPKGTSIRIKGIEQGKTPLRLLLQKGQHTIVSKSPCYQEKKTRVIFTSLTKRFLVLKQKPGRMLESHILYSKLVSSQRTFGIASFVTGGTLLLFGVTGQLIATSFHNQARGTEQQFQNKPIPQLASEYQQQASTGNTWRTLGTVGLGAAGLGIGLGIWRMATLPKVQAAPKQCQFD